jgi:hypothetical protein
VAQRTDVWRRWKAGESLHTIGRAFDRPPSIDAASGWCFRSFLAARGCADVHSLSVVASRWDCSSGSSALGASAHSDCGRIIDISDMFLSWSTTPLSEK